ncbi:hypothetical protein C8Q78DRAFT_1079470 [Trametes maxima]|nr:hypothetical protein C8Q78DRAFT_1079470 [Trametes maxima]
MQGLLVVTQTNFHLYHYFSNIQLWLHRDGIEFDRNNDSTKHHGKPQQFNFLIISRTLTAKFTPLSVGTILINNGQLKHHSVLDEFDTLDISNAVWDNEHELQPHARTVGGRFNTGAIVGGVIGGLAFLLLAACAFIIVRRRLRARRTAPSAEFMDLARGTTPAGAMRFDGATTPLADYSVPLTRESSLGDADADADPPPAFTPGSYADPVYEKVLASAALREHYDKRASYSAEHISSAEGDAGGDGGATVVHVWAQ